MASEYDKAALAAFGPGMSQIFQQWGQQRQNMKQFQAQLAMAELDRRDKQEAREEQGAINRRLLEMKEEAADLELKRYDEDVETREELTTLLGGYAMGAPDVPEAGRIAGREYMGGIQEAEGGMGKIRAMAAGLAPAMQKGAREAPRTPYETPQEYIRAQGLGRKEAGLLMGKLGVEAFMPKELDFVQFNAAFDYYSKTKTSYADIDPAYQKVIDEAGYNEHLAYIEELKKRLDKEAITEQEYNTLRNEDMRNRVAGTGIYARSYGGGGGGTKPSSNVFDAILGDDVGKLSDEELEKQLKETE